MGLTLRSPLLQVTGTYETSLWRDHFREHIPLCHQNQPDRKVSAGHLELRLPHAPARKIRGDTLIQ